MRLNSWTGRIAKTFAILTAATALSIGAAIPASASKEIPTGYVIGTVEWCNFNSYLGRDIGLSPGAGTLHLRARHNMSGTRDGICAYVTDDIPGSHWIGVKVRALGWSTSAWDADTYTTYAGAIGMHAMDCFDLVHGEVAVNGVVSTADGGVFCR
ncbi:MAG TPA: hypothetical protein VE465_08390 [Streptosporangiaceae bacterium]|nr:hypothetical protein [Streptosporangiaceae bacterium]